MLTSLDIITTKWIHHALWLLLCLFVCLYLCLCLYLLLCHASVLMHSHGFGFCCLFVCTDIPTADIPRVCFVRRFPAGDFREFIRPITGYEPRPDQPGL